MSDEVWPNKIWTKKREKIFLNLVIEERNEKFGPFPESFSFSEESWDKISQQFNELQTVTFDVAELKRRFAGWKKRHEIVEPLYNGGYGWDGTQRKIFIYDSDWEDMIEDTPEIEPYRKYGCPLYILLDTVFGSCTSTREDISWVGELDIHTFRGTDIVPKSGDKRYQSEAPSSGGPNKKRCAEADKVPIQPAAQSATPQTVDPYSAGHCISVINGMQGVDCRLYSEAIKLFKNPCWRETFISLKEEKRLNWPKAMFPKT